MITVKKMSNINLAKKVISILKQNGYEAYMVGGVVRDYLLKMPVSDIDITTNAKPYQVSKLFKTKPTGVKYGTVTVYLGTNAFEVTTYRIESEYQDNRHPEEVSFEATVEDDVKRRDFTINGMLMTEALEIIDYVGGKADLQAKMIKTIGNPIDRFNEDALRIIRAFYFQAKLGFQIDKETREAIHTLRGKLLEISNERILMEMIKMFKGPYLKKAIHTMITTGVHEVLPGLKEGLLYVNTLEEMPYIDNFFTLSFALHGNIPNEWKFSNKHRHRYEIGAYLAKQPQPFDPYTLYTYGLDLCLLGNRIAYILGYAPNLKQTIEKEYQQLPIQSDLDLKLSATELIETVGKKAGAWVKQLQTKMVIEILNRRLINEKDALKAYALSEQKE